MYFAVDYDSGEYEIFYFEEKEDHFNNSFIPKGIKRIIKFSKRSERDFQEWISVGLLEEYVLEDERQVINWLFKGEK